jgi:TRAP-type C4-dicarboxylate transport system permease small subunit
MAAFAALLIVFVMLSISIDVFSRYITGTSLVWVFEFSEYALLYIPCLGMAWLARERGHIAIITFIEVLSPPTFQRFQNLTTAACALVCSVIAYWGWVVLIDKIERGSVAVKAIEIPEFWIYWVIPFGFTLTAIEFTRQLFVKGGVSGDSSSKELPQ